MLPSIVVDPPPHYTDAMIVLKVTVRGIGDDASPVVLERPGRDARLYGTPGVDLRHNAVSIVVIGSILGNGSVGEPVDSKASPPAYPCFADAGFADAALVGGAISRASNERAEPLAGVGAARHVGLASVVWDVPRDVFDVVVRACGRTPVTRAGNAGAAVE